MASIGIDQQINCYSMYPWGATRYFDEKSGDWISIQPEPGTQEFADFWRPFLLDFREHLKENGWFEKTAIAMDEKLEPIMAGVISFIKETTPDFKIALAGGYIPSLQEDIYDLSIFVGHPTTSENMQARIAQGKPTTFYTSCSWPEHPTSSHSRLLPKVLLSGGSHTLRDIQDSCVGPTTFGCRTFSKIPAVHRLRQATNTWYIPDLATL